SPELSQAVNSMPNANLKWETTNSVNTGLDFGFLGGRLFGTYDFYVSNTKDLLYNINIPNINGIASSIATNIGKLNNRGHELGITGIPIRNKDFEWSVTFNFSTNKNKVKTILGIDADGDGKEDDLVSSGIFIGQPLDAIYSYNIIGMWQLEDYRNGVIPSGFTYGTYKIEDINKDEKYTADYDRKIVGYSEPLYRFSLQNNFRYKDFELNVFINSVQGGSDHYLGQPNADLPIPDHVVQSGYMKFDYWTPENPNAKYRQLGAYTQSLGPGFSPYVSRSFIRLQELSLAYNVPADVLKKIFVNRARVYVSAYNLFTITGWDGWDPEANQGLGFNIGGGYPTMKSFTVGVNFEF
ncbi:SusC/RagA family TonB-linked outer membrane protein, partial [Parabacteroides sp. OttesenSCG-928-O15]|nr:SusC/RagA family TonB-linked outer membrane protein [Parabacteroides sp. OttesenSCG-928-O15]